MLDSLLDHPSASIAVPTAIILLALIYGFAVYRKSLGKKDTEHEVKNGTGKGASVAIKAALEEVARSNERLTEAKKRETDEISLLVKTMESTNRLLEKAGEKDAEQIRLLSMIKDSCISNTNLLSQIASEMRFSNLPRGRE